MQWRYELLLNHSWFLCTKWKPSSFFSAHLLEIDQAQLENSNYYVLLSTWLVSTEICPKGIFVSIWYLPVQVKAHKKTHKNKGWDLQAEAYWKSCQTSKEGLFAKILNGFQMLLSLSSKLLHTDAYSEPSWTFKMELWMSWNVFYL